MLVRCRWGCNSAADVLVELPRLLEHPTGLGARSCGCKATKAPQTRQLKTDQGRSVCQGWAPPYRSGMRHHLWCMLTCVRFMWLFLWTEKPCVVCSYYPEGLLAGQVRLFPVSVTYSNYVQIYAFPSNCLTKVADGPVEATWEKFKVKSHFREMFRCSRIMIDG